MKELEGKPFWKLWKQRMKCFWKEGHVEICIFSANLPGLSHYDTLVRCKKCNRSRWIKTTDWIPN